jgi:hypothetical protein
MRLKIRYSTVPRMLRWNFSPRCSAKLLVLVYHCFDCLVIHVWEKRELLCVKVFANFLTVIHMDAALNKSCAHHEDHEGHEGFGYF